MSWQYVTKLNSGDNVINFVVPPIPYVEGAHAGSDTIIAVGGRYDLNPDGYAEGVTAANELTSQQPSYDWRKETMPKTYLFDGKNGGGVKIPVANNFPYSQSFTPSFFDQSFVQIGSLSMSLGNYSVYDYDFFTYGGSFICLIDDEQEKMFFGLCFWEHMDQHDGENTYHIAVAEIAVFDAYLSQHNVYSIFRSQVPQLGPDPYGPGNYSQPSGPPAGDFDDSSDEITIPEKPPFNLAFTHFISVYAPDLTELNDFADYLWGNFDKWDQNKLLSKIFSNPIESVLSLHMLPFEVDTSTAIEVSVGAFATGVNMKPAAEQFHDVDCGSLAINPYWGNYLDYNPYCKLTLVLPFVGQVSLDPDEVMGETISIKYRCDVVTGAFVCFVKTATKVLGQYAGNCALNVPVTSADYSRLNAAIIQSAAMVAGTAGGALAGGMAAPAGAGAGLMAGASDAAKIGSSVFGAAQNVQNSKLHVAHSGGLSGAPGFMGIQKPYLIIHRARQSVPENANAFYGYPSNCTFTLNSLSGFTSVKSIKLDGIPFTEDEISELRSILAGGIYI